MYVTTSSGCFRRRTSSASRPSSGVGASAYSSARVVERQTRAGANAVRKLMNRHVVNCIGLAMRRGRASEPRPLLNPLNPGEPFRTL